MRKDLECVSVALTALLLAGCGTGNAAAAPSAAPTLARATTTSAQATSASLPLMRRLNPADHPRILIGVA